MTIAASRQLWIIAAACLGCSSRALPVKHESTYRGGQTSQARAADAVMITIPDDSYVIGSTPEERDQAYADYRDTAGHDGAMRGQWFKRETERRRVKIAAFKIDLTPVTQGAYAEFVADTGRPQPAISAADWKAQGFVQDYDTEVARFNWHDGEPDPQRVDHPVVLVTWQDADSYCRWRGDVVGEARRLPTAMEFEAAARGRQGLVYPWGMEFDPSLLNSAVSGPRDTVSVGSHARGASPFGVQDAAGNVFQWTATRWPHQTGRMTVKGSAWDDFGGLGRGAAEHGRPATVRHAIVGFRCAGD